MEVEEILPVSEEVEPAKASGEVKGIDKKKGEGTMPLGDGTGPVGMGPMTGRAVGYCAG